MEEGTANKNRLKIYRQKFGELASTVCTYLFQEIREAFVDDGLDDTPVDICEPNTHQSPHDEKCREEVNVASFFAGVVRQHDLYQTSQSIPEGLIHISTATLLFGRFHAACCIKPGA